MFERVHGLERARAERTELAHAEVIDLARGGAEAQREIIYSMRALLQVVAARLRRGCRSIAADCNQYLTDLTGNIPWIRGAVASPEPTAESYVRPTRARSD